MIKLTRPGAVPAILITAGKTKTGAIIRSYTKYATDYESGAKKFEFDSGIYGHSTVKEALITAQDGKCCYCESRITHIAYGDIEHFRPKSGYQQAAKEARTSVGYYWLVYDWDNLLFSCELCNRRHKRNRFFLSNPKARAKSQRDDLTRERPLLVNPYLEDPELHISFRKEVPYPVDNSRRGKHTIDVLGLDRPPLNVVRLDSYVQLKMLYEIANLKPEIPQSKDAKAFLNKSILDTSEFASLARAAIKAKFCL